MSQSFDLEFSHNFKVEHTLYQNAWELKSSPKPFQTITYFYIQKKTKRNISLFRKEKTIFLPSTLALPKLFRSLMIWIWNHSFSSMSSHKSINFRKPFITFKYFLEENIYIKKNPHCHFLSSRNSYKFHTPGLTPCIIKYFS